MSEYASTKDSHILLTLIPDANFIDVTQRTGNFSPIEKNSGNMHRERMKEEVCRSLVPTTSFMSEDACVPYFSIGVVLGSTLCPYKGGITHGSGASKNLFNQIIHLGMKPQVSKY